MLEPVRCFTCSKSISHLCRRYQEEYQKRVDDAGKQGGKRNEGVEDRYYDTVKMRDVLDDLGLDRYCCRRTIMTYADLMEVL